MTDILKCSIINIINSCNSICAQINNVFCYFKSTSIIIKIKLLMLYCCSHCGAELGICVTFNNICDTWHNG